MTLAEAKVRVQNNEKIPYGRQHINQSDIDSVISVLKSDFLTQGPTTPMFERLVGSHVGADHVVAVNSATSALHIACVALGVQAGDLVWTSPITFVATANSALYCGAKVDFVDIDPRTYNISAEKLAAKLKSAKDHGRLPKVVIPVHMCGQSCDMESIHSLSQEYGFSIIEDAAHAIGGRYKNEFIGGSKYSDITVFSFHPVKIITTGEGGVAVTNDPLLARRLRLLRSHGITSTMEEMRPMPERELWNYQQIDLGFNYRMTDIQAALGVSQIRRLDEFVSKRQAIAKRYDRLLEGLPVKTPWQHPDTYSSYHLYPIRISLEQTTKTRREVYDTLRNKGVLVNLHYIPVYRQPFYSAMGFVEGYCPEAERYFHETISMPIYPGLTETQQDFVVDALRMAFA